MKFEPSSFHDDEAVNRSMVKIIKTLAMTVNNNGAI